MSKLVITVDDSAKMREVLHMSLESAGYQVMQAVDGVDALEKMATGKFDLLVTDLNMPNMDGISLIKAVRRNPHTRLMPIIIVSSEAQDKKKAEGFSAGASGWVKKPFRLADFLNVVRLVCPL